MALKYCRIKVQLKSQNSAIGVLKLAMLSPFCSCLPFMFFAA